MFIYIYTFIYIYIYPLPNFYQFFQVLGVFLKSVIMFCFKNMGGVCWLGIVCALYCFQDISLGQAISLVNITVYIVVTRDDIAQYKHTALCFPVLSVVDQCYYLFYKQPLSLCA